MRRTSPILLAAAILVAALFLAAVPSQAQWAFVGTDIRNTNSGNVRIGNITPRGSKVSIGGGMSLNDAINTNRVFLIGYNATKDFAFLSPWDWGASAWKNLVINAGGGLVAIGGNPVPGYKLSVGGALRADSLSVPLVGGLKTEWPDFVFAEDYQLAPLGEVESFVRSHGHLPDVPPVEELASTGLDLGAMQARLLQKVEELTLYAIEQDKRLARLEAENQELRQAAADER